MRFKLEFEYEQLSTWAWMYTQGAGFSARSLPGHWSALKWFADLEGLRWPPKDSLCMRKLRRVTRALRLRDPSVETRCFALTNNWLVAMMLQDGLRCVADFYTCPLTVLGFWARVRCAHFAMMRLCEHASGMLFADVQRHESSGTAASLSAVFFTLRVGYLPAGLAPLYATNRKLKLRSARHPVLPIWNHVSSAGAILRAWISRVHFRQPSVSLLFPAVQDGYVLPVPLSSDAFLRRLRASAAAAGMPPADVKRIESRSLRAGGCTDFFARGLAREAIMRQGGWSSDTVDIYNRPSAFHRWASFSLLGSGFGRAVLDFAAG